LIEASGQISASDLDELNEFDINPVSKAGLIGALLHKLSSAEKVYPWELLNLTEPADIRTSYTVSIDDPESMFDEIKSSPYPIIKIKMGFEQDEALLPRLKAVGGKLFRIDANGGWTPEKAERMIYSLNKLDVDVIEQPTGVEYMQDWKYIKGRSKINFIIDEGLNRLDDYFRYAEYVDGINIKMAKSGGIVEAQKIAARAKKDKLKVMLGCMLESSVGISQSVYLSSLADYFDLDAPLLLKEDVAEGICFQLEKISVDEDIIGGPRMKKEFLDG